MTKKMLAENPGLEFALVQIFGPKVPTVSNKAAQIDDLAREIDHLVAEAEDCEQGNVYEQQIAFGLRDEAEELQLKLNDLLED